MSEPTSLQEQFAPELACFGCGPANKLGLQIKSFVRGDRVFAQFQPAEHHQAFPGVVNGGIVGALLDCHMNWTAAWHLMNLNELESPPCTVTAYFTVNFDAPTPSDAILELQAWVVEASPRKAKIEATLGYDGQVTARGEGVFVSVEPGHPAYHRW